ncbi:MAG: HEAT repeat domain-containing protein [Acidobacteria bacterium]|nr:HEAT repeat domain-containing protein [Acidobacteriota bacterium]
MKTACSVLVLVLCMASLRAQEPAVAPGREAVTTEQVKAGIEKLGTLDFAVRTEAARTVRRAGAVVAVPLLSAAARAHKDGYVRFRALVLLSGFNAPNTRDVMSAMLTDKNDRLRAVAYAYFAHNPDPATLPRLIEALSREESEFVRPALTRAIVAHGTDPRARETVLALIMKGQDFFRSAVIEAAGDYRLPYAVAPLSEIAKLDGPLQDDAVIALGKIGEKRSLDTFAALQRTAPKTTQPAIAAAICLLGVNCASHQGYLSDSLKFGTDQIGYQELVRNAASALGALGVKGNPAAVTTLLEQGAPSRDPARAAIALALGTVALRNTPLLLQVLEKEKDPAPALELLREAFDMLEEDFEEERFFAHVRRTYWQSPAASPARKTAEALIRKLEF